jgi:BlaI family penicillinase repressor
MPVGQPDVTEAELEVLQSLWGHGPSTIRQLAERLYPSRRSSPTATVLKLLERLEAKACVQRDSSGPVHVFKAIVAREDLIERRLTAVAESLCEGSRTPLLTHLFDANRLTKEEIETLVKLVDELTRQTDSGQQSR